MDLRLLQYFTAVCDHGSLHAAAAAVHVAQPSLSRQIRRLESELGFALFDRSPRGLGPTAAGRAFLPVARDLLTRSAQVETIAAAIARGGVPELTVVAAGTTVADIIAPFVVRAGRQGAIANVIEANPERVYSHLLTGEADFAVGTRLPSPEFDHRIVGHAYLWAQVHPDHRFARLESVAIGDLVTEPIVAMARSHGVRQMFDNAVASADLTYAPAFETESAATAQALAAAERGVCVLSDDSRYGLTSLPIRVRDQELSITLYGVWSSLHFAAAQISDTLDELGAFIDELYPRTRREPSPGTGDA